MFDGVSKPTLLAAALVGGLALFVAGFVIALEVRSTIASPAAASTGGACYTNWNGNTCASGYTAVETGQWTAVATTLGSQTDSNLICASPKAIDSTREYVLESTAVDDADSHNVVHEPCAICCATGVGGAVGGIAELPDVAGAAGGYNYVAVAVIATAGVVALAAGGWYARRRWQG